MKIYDAPGEVRVTADHRPVTTIPGQVSVHLDGPGRCGIYFVPTRKRYAQKGWTWCSPYTTSKYIRAEVWSAGERFAYLDLNGDEGCWIPAGGALTIMFYRGVK